MRPPSLEGLKLRTNVKIAIHTNRVRVNPDGSSTTIGEARWSRAVTTNPAAWSRAVSRGIRRVVLFLAAIGAAQMAYIGWEARSDAAAARVYHASPSCDLASLSAADPVPTTSGDCRLEDVVVVERDWHTQRAGKPFYLKVLSHDGRRDDINLSGPVAVALWHRVSLTQRIMVQRFAAPGYHLTGSITALTDGHLVALTNAHPDAGRDYAAIGIGVGAGLLVFVVLLVPILKSGRRPR